MVQQNNKILTFYIRVNQGNIKDKKITLSVIQMKY